MITQNDYKGFKTLFNDGYFDSLTYGRAFCNHFNIEDDVLAGEENPARADKLIVNNYLDWN